MRKSRRPIIIAARGSLLARRQAKVVGEAMGRLNPHVDVQYRWLTSEGDQHPHEPLSNPGAGAQGWFVKTIERTVLEGDADIAVHSLKDLPASTVGEGLTIAAVPTRGDVRDCLITHQPTASLDQLAPGASVGTASPRREAQLRRIRPDLNIRLIRGNVETRLDKVLQDQAYDATIMAAAGLQRAGLGEHATHPLPLALMLPAAGQGALAVQCRTDDHVTIRRCLPLNDPATATAVHAERAVVAELGAGCHCPLAVLASPVDDRGFEGFRVQARVLSLDGTRILEADEQVTANDLGKLTQRIVDNLLDHGAESLLAETPTHKEAPAH